jgi:hypothetical protein
MAASSCDNVDVVDGHVPSASTRNAQKPVVVNLLKNFKNVALLELQLRVILERRRKKGGSKSVRFVLFALPVPWHSEAHAQSDRCR